MVLSINDYTILYQKKQRIKGGFPSAQADRPAKNAVMKQKLFFLPWIAVLLILMLTSAALAIEPDALAGEGKDAVFGTENVSSLSDETPIGDLCADAARFAADADIAVLNSGDIGGNLLGGTITYADCLRIFNEDRVLAVATVSPAELKDLLEIGVSRIVMDSEEMTDREASAWGGFPQISGFDFEYDVSSLPGSRIRWIRIDGNRLDLTDSTPSLRLCATEYFLSGGWDSAPVEAESLPVTLSEALFRYIESEGTISPPPGSDRIFTGGSKDNGIFDSLGISPLFLFIAVLIFGAVRSWRFKEHYDFKR